MFFVPFLWMIFSSLDSDATLAISLPDFSLDNYVSVLTSQQNQLSFLYGIFISLGQAILVVIISVLAAYPLSRYQLKYKKSFMYIILFATGLPITAVMVPVYQLFIILNIYDSLFWTMIFFTASSLPYAIWMMKNYIDSIPIELEEASWVDGASIMKGIRIIIAPLLLPGIFTVGIFTFVLSWGNFLVPFILIQSVDKYPASVRIFQFFDQYGMVDYGELAAFSVIYTVPAIILYLLSQRFTNSEFSFSGATK
jgi:multiple sugar transport system permease protein